MDKAISYIRFLGSSNILMGLWIAMSPSLFDYSSPPATAGSVITGTAIVIFGIIRQIAPETSWPSWVNFCLGLWVTISPFTLQLSAASAQWNLIIAGLLVSLVSYANTQFHTTHTAM